MNWNHPLTQPCSCPLSMGSGRRETWGIGWGTVAESWPLVVCPCRRLSQWDCVMGVEPVWKSAPNATGASCPQVHYSHWHWANWLTCLCSTGGLTLKWEWGKRELYPQLGWCRPYGGGEGRAKSKPKLDGSALTYLWLLFIRLFGLCGSVQPDSLWIVLIRFHGSQTFEVVRGAAWCEQVLLTCKAKNSRTRYHVCPVLKWSINELIKSQILIIDK